MKEKIANHVKKTNTEAFQRLMRRGSTTNDRKNIIRFIFTKKGRDMSPIPIFLRKSQKKHQKPNKKSWTFSPSSPPKMWFTTLEFSHFFGDSFVFFPPWMVAGVDSVSMRSTTVSDPGSLKKRSGGWWLSGWLTDLYPRHLYLASLSLASKRVPWRCRYRGRPRPRVGDTRGLGLGVWVRLVVSSEWRIFLGWKMKGRGFLEPNPKKWRVWNGRWVFRFEIW